MFQLSNTCEIEHLEMLAQSFSANVSTNLSKISKCCWELPTEQVVPALAGKEKMQTKTQNQDIWWEKACRRLRNAQGDIWKMCFRCMRWKYRELFLFCVVISSLTLTKAVCASQRGSFFQNMRQMISEGNLRFLALPPTPTCLTQQWASSDSQLGIPRMVNAAATVHLWLSTFIWIELTG